MTTLKRSPFYTEHSMIQKYEGFSLQSPNLTDGFTAASGSHTLQEDSNPGRGVVRKRQRLCFMVRPYSGVMSTVCPGMPLNFNLWMRMARNRKTSDRAMSSPTQRRLPRPKIMTFSPSILLSSAPSALRKRSGLKTEGSFHVLLLNENQYIVFNNFIWPYHVFGLLRHAAQTFAQLKFNI